MRHFTCSLLACTLLATPALAAPKVMASIVPVHSLVSGVMEGVGEPTLLLQGQNSEHQASYSPQQLKLMGEADAVFIIGEGLELKLDELSGSEAVKGKSFVALAEVKNLTTHPIREGGVWATDSHDHGHEEEGHEEGHDPHIWLDPTNAKLMTEHIAATLIGIDAANTTAYRANADKQIAMLDALTAELETIVAPVKAKPFIVFHDAYQYFEKRFGLNGAGSISDFVATAPSAKRLREVRKKITDVKATCVFREPQFSDKSVTTVIEGTSAKPGVLDPIGAELKLGKDAYGQLLRNLAQNLAKCLQG